METTKANPYIVQSELFQEMNEDRGLGDTPDVKSKRHFTTYLPYEIAILIIYTIYKTINRIV